jgi:hypothetical protein
MPCRVTGEPGRRRDGRKTRRQSSKFHTTYRILSAWGDDSGPSIREER